MNSWRILLADGDPIIRRSLEASLVQDGFEVASAADGMIALEKAEQRWPDLALLDLELPGFPGSELAARLTATIPLPILVLTAHRDLETTVHALEAFADDYVTKPFRYPELRARIRRSLARAYDGTRHPGQRVVIDDQLVLHFGQRVATVGGRSIRLTPIEARILFVLVQNRGWLVPTATLLRKAWPPGEEGDHRSLWVRMRHLRGKLEAADGPRYIHTERGIGYCFQSPGDHCAAADAPLNLRIV